MSEHQAFQQRTPNMNEVVHTGVKGQKLSRYELTFINESWRKNKEETYRGDGTLAFYQKFNSHIKSELDALILKLNNKKDWLHAYIYDNTGAEKRKVVLHIKKGGEIETDLINYPTWQMPDESTKKQ